MSKTATTSRRGFVKRAAYVAPAIITLIAAPAFAKSGSEKLDIWKIQAREGLGRRAILA